MARRTKADALATRDNILDAAEQLFLKQGVSRTTLQDIAISAGVTRGAIYWHFADKATLFNSMMERAKMPLEAAMQILTNTEVTDPLLALREYMSCVFRLVVEDMKARHVFEIATFKLELVDELMAVRDRRIQNQKQWMHLVETCIDGGVRQGKLALTLPVSVMTLGMWAILDGLIRTWLLDPQAFDLIKTGKTVTDAYLNSHVVKE